MLEEFLVRRLASVRRIGFLGLAKNTGKTTAFNFVAGVLRTSGERLGLLTCGRDGETTDLLYGNPKPPVEVFPGQRLLTTDGEAGRATARLESIGDTAFRTALGPLRLFEVEGAGEVVLVGPVTVEELAEALDRLLASGCDRVLVDGAVNRRAFARSGVVDGIVVCTGAALAGDVDRIVRATADALAPYLLPVENPAEEARVPGSRLQVAGSAAHPSEPVPGDRLVVDRAFTDQSGEDLIEAGFRGTVVVADAAGVFCEPYTLARLSTVGIRVAVRERVPILALCANPTSPIGRGVEGAKLLARLGEAFPSIPVMDVKACRLNPHPS
jgi:hypothetical protein